MNTQNEYLKLLDLLGQVIEANKGPLNGPDDRYWYAEGLTTKFFLHAVSVFYLCRGSKIPDFPSVKISLVDTASIEVLTRAAIETFLTFHCVFFAPKTAEERDYRYWAWRAAGLKERQGLPVSTEQHEQKLTNEKREIVDIHNKLHSNLAFQQLKPKQQKKVLNGNWRLTSWSDIAAHAGLGKLLASDMYRSLSGYAHSSYLSILQLNQALLNKDQSIFINSSMNTMQIIAANMIHEYCELFPRAKDALDADPEGNILVNMFIQIGHNIDA